MLRDTLLILVILAVTLLGGLEIYRMGFQDGRMEGIRSTIRALFPQTTMQHDDTQDLPWTDS